MSRQVSPSTGRVYGRQRVARLWGVARATIYRHRRPEDHGERPRPGPQGAMSDEDLARGDPAAPDGQPVARARAIASSWARRRFAGVRTSRRRALRLTCLARPPGPSTYGDTARLEGARRHHHHRAGRGAVGQRPDLGDDGCGSGRGVRGCRASSAAPMIRARKGRPAAAGRGLGRVRRHSCEPQG